jgi:autotransporter-associated beta strand protein
MIPGPVSPVFAYDGNYSGWFPDAHFPLVWGGPNEPDKKLSWWMDRREGTSLDDAADSPGGMWVPGGPWGSGDHRGHWITSVYRPTDYAPDLYGTTVNLSISSTDNSTWTTQSHVIDHDYLVGFAHIEDYDSNGNVVNGNRTLYSVDNGLNWLKGPRNHPAYLVAVDERTNPGSPRLVSIGWNSLMTSNNLATATGWTTTPISMNPSNFAYPHSLFFNRYLGKWMLWYGRWGNTNSLVWPAVSDDLITWDFSMGALPLSYSNPGGVTQGNGDYPTLIGSRPSGQTYGALDTEVGQLGWLYNNSGGGLAGRAIHFIKELRQDLTWGGPAGGNLHTTANWTATAGGAYAGLIDEKNSLTIGAGSGTLNNDVPVTKRVRSLAFTSAAGAYTVSGNTLQLQASNLDNVWVSLSNNSASTQTIETGIIARSAAIYVRSNGGGMNLNGPIDLHGSGGLVVYGTGATTINGVISNTPYRTFTGNQLEDIGAANVGRLVKQDAATLTLGGANTFAGRTDIRGGVVHLAHPDALQNSVVTFGTDNALTLGASSKLGGLNGAGDLALGAFNLTLGNNNPPTNYGTRHTGVISGTASVTKVGGSVQRLGATNTYSGGTTISAGVLEIPGSTNTALGSGTVTVAGGTLKAVGAASLNNAITLGAGGGTFNVGAANLSLSGVISGGNQLRAEGGNTLTLSGVNTYSGGTNVKSLVQAAGNQALGSGSVTVVSGGKLRAGQGTTPGMVTVTGATINSGAEVQSNVNSATVGSYGQVVVQGTGNLGGVLPITRNAGFNPAVGQAIFPVLRNAGSGTFSQVVIVDGSSTSTFSGAEGATIIVGAMQGTLTYSAQSTQGLTSGNKDVRIQFTGPVLPSGTYRIVARHSGKALRAMGTTDGSDVQQYTYGGGNDQRWQVTHLGSGQFSIREVTANKALDVQGSNTADGANIHLWGYGGGNNQRWVIAPASVGSSYFRVINVNSGKGLDISGASQNDGAVVLQWPYNGSTNQQWSFLAP